MVEGTFTDQRRQLQPPRLHPAACKANRRRATGGRIGGFRSVEARVYETCARRCKKTPPSARGSQNTPSVAEAMNNVLARRNDFARLLEDTLSASPSTWPCNRCAASLLAESHGSSPPPEAYGKPASERQDPRGKQAIIAVVRRLLTAFNAVPRDKAGYC